MQVENDYEKEVYNGDLGIVSRIDVEPSELTVQFDGRDDHPSREPKFTPPESLLDSLLEEAGFELMVAGFETAFS